jgi:asparagine synthase (glutamine-hydrolysing)
MDTAGMMRADLWTNLSENCLVKTDRVSMAHGLEVACRSLATRCWTP